MSSMGNSHDNAQNGSEESSHLNHNKPNNKNSDNPSNPINRSSNNNHNHTKHSQQGVGHIDKDFSSIAALNKKLNQPFAKLTQQSTSLSPSTQGLSGTSAHAVDAKQQAVQQAIKQVRAKQKKQQREEELARLYSERQLTGSSVRHPNFSDMNVNSDAFDVANFNVADLAPDPARALTDIPEPTPRYQSAIQHLLAGSASVASAIYTESAKTPTSKSKISQSDASVQHDDTSMWGLIASPELASHLELLQLGGLINLPAQFFEPIPAPSKSQAINATKVANATDTESQASVNNQASADHQASRPSHDQEWSLLAPLSEMTLLDLADIQQACQAYPSLTRYGFATDDNPVDNQADASANSKTKTNSSKTKTKSNKAKAKQARHKAQATALSLAASMPEMINDVFAPNWELILYPERFDNGVDSLATDILDCSVAVHILKQCQTRQTINRRLTAQQICQHMRSYVLSQCNRQPQFEKQYRQIRLFAGHVVVAAHYLGWDVLYAKHHTSHSVTDCQGKTSSNLGQPIYFNVSSRSALFHRYPNISSYYINGWS
ncbi:hypothetical protein [Psychrobacter lutiphocae]|uniref:hypothetical protein n=1 Tax=Psychrobacter lutiphocae TaxID=540500 RepID=UPI000375CCC8|nr:hypothetical protein [Psychrobacter lutiphocae]